MDKPCKRMAIELSREDRYKRAKKVVGGVHIVIGRFVQVKVQGDELVGTEAFTTRVKGPKRLHVHQC